MGTRVVTIGAAQGLVEAPVAHAGAVSQMRGAAPITDAGVL